MPLRLAGWNTDYLRKEVRSNAIRLLALHLEEEGGAAQHIVTAALRGEA